MRRKKIFLCLVLTLFFVFTSGQITYADSSNGQTGEGTINSPYSGYYFVDQFGWRISMYAAKDIGLTEIEYKNSSLTQDFYYIGTINIINNITISNNTQFGEFGKLYYLDNHYPSFSDTVKRYVMSDCPAPPIACKGNIDEVNAYFLRNTTIMAVLDKLVDEQGLDERFDLVRNLDFTCHYYDEGEDEEYTVTKTGEEWGESLVLPYSERDNAVPWVIIYEPMVCVHLAGEEAQIFMTATEMAMSQGLIYNWHTIGSDSSFVWNWNGIPYLTSMIKPQCVQSLAFKNLPASVSLEFPWFGFSTIEKAEGEAWSATEVRDCGGWGMGFLSSKNISPAGSALALEAIEPNAAYTMGTEVISSFLLKNEGENDVRPGDRISVHFTVAKQNGTMVYETDSEFVALPAGESEYIWFRWTVPGNLQSRVVVSAEIDSGTTEINCDAEYTATVTSLAESHTRNPEFADENPAGFPAMKPRLYTTRAAWYYWEYVDGVFVKRIESVNISPRLNLVCRFPMDDEDYDDPALTTRSGYGFDCYGEVRIQGDFSPESVTGAQNVFFTFPEFLYSDASGSRETAEKVGAYYMLRQNPNPGSGRTHYIPLWYPDGDENYTVLIYARDCWTPAGALSSTQASVPLSIKGSMYDDWYVGY